MVRRLRQNAMVFCPDRTSSATRPAVSPLGDTRAPVTSSSGGGFHTATRRSLWGDPSSLTASTGTPHTAEASRSG